MFSFIILHLITFRNNQINCSLWSDFAGKIESYFATHDMSSPVILILQFGKLRKYLGAILVLRSF